MSHLIEELQYTLGEGPCVDAYRQDTVVAEPDLADPATGRWPVFSPPALQAGARAVFGFPLRVGTVRLGALNFYRDRPGPLSGDQHADALVVTDVAARWVLEAQAGAPPDTVAEELEAGADFHFVVHNAAGMVSVQEQVSVTEALIRLRAFAFSSDRLLAEVAGDVVARRLRLGHSDPRGISPDISMTPAPVTPAIPGHTPHSRAEDHALPPADNSARIRSSLPPGIVIDTTTGRQRPATRSPMTIAHPQSPSPEGTKPSGRDRAQRLPGPGRSPPTLLPGQPQGRRPATQVSPRSR